MLQSHLSWCHTFVFLTLKYLNFISLSKEDMLFFLLLNLCTFKLTTGPMMSKINLSTACPLFTALLYNLFLLINSVSFVNYFQNLVCYSSEVPLRLKKIYLEDYSSPLPSSIHLIPYETQLT